MLTASPYRIWVCAVVMTVLCVCSWVQAADGSVSLDRPNIVVIMADDVGPGDIGYYHRQRTGTEPLAPTPVIDELARSGMRFSQAHSSTALCSPTRYCAMTGNLNHRSYAPWGVWGSFRQSPVKDKDATLGRVGKLGGLTTGFIGKWHLGGDFMDAKGEKIFRGNDHGATPDKVDCSRMVGGGPADLGFDYSVTLPCGIQGPLYVVYENGEWLPFSDESKLIYFSEETAGDPAYVSDKGPGVGDSHWDTKKIGPLLSAKAVDFIESNAEAGQPFMLVYWSPMVHLPHIPPDEFDGRKVRGQTPTKHLDMLIDLDQQVARIVDALKRTGEYDNTLIIFTSDNGGLHDGKAQKHGHDSSGGVRGFKNDPYEGGHRVPFFAVWPGHIPADVDSDELVAVHDVVPTVARLLGVTLRGDQAMDALDLTPLLLGRDDFQGRREMLLQGGSRNEVIYYDWPWKLIIQSNHPMTKWEPRDLFNMEENPLEKASGNLINDPAQAERVKKMFDRYMELRQSGERTTPPM